MLHCYVKTETSLLCIGNDKVELKLDRKTGFIRDIFNKETGIHHKDGENSGIWPFGLRLGDMYSSNLLWVEMNADPRSARQEMTYKVRSKEWGKTLEMCYDDLNSTGGSSTGVKLTVYITIKDKADYFLIKAKVENNGKYGITRLFSGWGGLVADASREKERLAVPDWSFGSIWKNPHKFFTERGTLGYPIMGGLACLDAGWIDLYSERGGIGIGYLNKQRLTMFFNVQSQGDGTGINWQLFDLMDDKAFEYWDIVEGIYPLKPGETFTTDPWILAPHAGDWHRMADIYRQEYEETFEGEYQTWEKTNEIAKNIDLSLVYTVLNVRGWPPTYGEDTKTYNKFSDVPRIVKEFNEKAKIDPKNLVVSVVGHSSHWALYMPDWLPCCPEGGGDKACKAMIAELRKMGVEAVMFYIHLHYNHPKANDYVAEADTGYDHQNANWKEIGHVACVANEAWQKLWKEKYIPGFDEIDAPGVLIDEGAVQWLVCADKRHSHGTKAANVLSAQVKGILGIIQAFRDGYKKRNPIIWTEQGNDLQTPTVDIWSGSYNYLSAGMASKRPLSNERIPKYELIRYTFPYRICTVATAKKWDTSYVNDVLVNGFFLGGYFGLSATSMWPKSVDSAVRQYIRVRRELRENKSSGYPQGFKDTIGLTVGNSNLVARVYRSGNGITVVYYAKEDVATTVTVDRESLGFPGSGEESFQVSLKKDQAAYKILKS